MSATRPRGRPGLLLLLLLAPCVLPAAADEPRRRGVVFFEPDAETEREIEKELIDPKGIGSSTRDVRTAARARLVEIGPWTVPYLCRALAPGTGERIPMNAAFTLARVDDRHAIPTLERTAEDHGHVGTRTAAALALGVFRAGLDTLKGMLDPREGRRPPRAALLALARVPGARTELQLHASSIGPRPDQPPFAAAALLAAALASEEGRAACLAQLGHDDDLVRQAAAIGLLVRPLPADRPEPLLERFARPDKDRLARVLQVRALAAITPRPEVVRAQLLAVARDPREKRETRIAALVGLAAEPGVRATYEDLRKLYRAEGRGNDPLVGALLFALARTGEPRAADDLLAVVRSGSSFLAAYAVGSLLDRLVEDPRAWPEPHEVFDRLERRRANEDDALLREILDVARVVRTLTDPEERRTRGRELLAAARDPRGLHLWDRTPEERVWETVNGFVLAILAVDDIADRGTVTAPGPPGGGGTQVGGGPRDVSGSPDEQDLIDFLAEAPYFGPEDLGRAAQAREGS